MAESRLCLICGAVVDSSKITVHRQFHAEVDRMTQVIDDLRQQVKRLEVRVKRTEDAQRQPISE